MITIHKDPGRDFIILNLTDPQMNNAEWEEGHPHRRTLLHQCGLWHDESLFCRTLVCLRQQSSAIA